ncbi:Phosphoribulokinase (EC [uncultured Gammaproteobacteria bacterium]|jgi:phosphoribulokinase|uniref:phosphoribulokinase n=1 Tax=thiotrophic endosymbiont of Bathymodiolus puteoserpentis (Logatchev) TaxID=343240 RepID=UPI0010BBE7CF|nr:phosphoribulokinase [thiotrophic endosymbiont of Bathymodiolus puteoserpentis (Logatchev)]CAC9492038.1 Phosphoribulokinase (EC 2.7.1.19) [uncultured Gammaproteobacteria bacterium]CAC9497588.1 Phosphoribulokinase (EC 2.7.1.19) [uncultured Gammaproteobacteria bacterium]CAC9569041.1 Phosphoribulokinase (EC 2.7.1.19) [uncultured Gammaproteobacteria bacterium]CAC9635518.1 Phosphoribulokinase (EC 2.7.1.19) [uncultured Gammaproteobacteria bacterium]CAC9651670.1 Phosphoribulokinase (EC 2.7.1.19) [u
MSKKNPVIVVTGSSGAGTTFVKRAFEHIFNKEGITPLIVEGDSYHKYDRVAMKKAVAVAEAEGNKNLSHFGPDANEFDKIEKTFKDYGTTGQCDRRYYIHSDEEAVEHNARLNSNLNPGEFTPWEKVGAGTDLLFYEGLHGAVVTDGIDMAQYGDLKIGVVPSVNLEWIQKISRDNAERGYSAEDTVDTILRRMPDYINYITPQFSQTDINFQRIATVDTSNPFITRDIPTPDESLVVIRFKDLNKTPVDFPTVKSMIEGSFMSRRNTIVVPGNKMGLAMEIILYPIIHDLIGNK